MYKHRDGLRARDPDAATPAPGRGGGAVGVPGKATMVAPTMALPPALRARLERALEADLSAVRVGEDPAVAAIGARAHADGTDVLFAPGEYQPDSPAGQALIAHEVIHLVQQAEGRVAANAEVGGRAVAADRGLEHEADDLGARALRGEKIRTSPAPALRAAGGPIQGFFGEQIGNFFEPHPTNEAVAHAQAARKAGDNVFESANDVQRDARTGLLPDEEALVHDFVVDSEKHLKTWLAKRGAKGSPDLRFEHGGDMASRYAQFRNDFAMKGTFLPAYLEAARRLKTGANKQIVLEIRMFAPDLLGDYAAMLGIDDKDRKPCHHYEFMAEFTGGDALSAWGVKGGLVTRRIRIRYTNSVIQGLSWEQSVELSGFVLGFSVSDKTGRAKTPREEFKASVSAEPPSGWKPAKEAQAKYLGPDFFDGADYTRPSAGASAKAGMVKAGGSKAHLLIGKNGNKLSWELPLGFKFSASMSESSLKDGLKAGAEVEGVIEAGRSSLIGDAEYHPGKWDKLKYTPKPTSDEWIVLHAARVHFATGSSAIGPEDVKTLRRVVEAIHDRDKMKGYEGQIFKIEVSGCHSQIWERYDDKLRKFDGRDPSTLTEAERKERDELQLLKDAENDSLAYMRATHTSEELKGLLGTLHSRMHLGVMKASTMEAATTHDPTSSDPYSNLASERSATVTVRYQIHTPDGQVPSDIPESPLLND
jgi:hypothetical protein